MRTPSLRATAIAFLIALLLAGCDRDAGTADGPSFTPDCGDCPITWSQSSVQILGRTGTVESVLDLPAGLWSAPSWSPDGSQLVLVLNNHALVIAGVTGDTSMRIYEVHGLDTIRSPTWSPTSETIAFERVLADGSDVKHQIAEVSTSGGDPVVVAAGYAPAWSPDGQELAFLSTGGKVAVVDPDSGRVTKYVTADGGPTWAADGRHLLFETLGHVWQSRILTLRDGSSHLLLEDAASAALSSQDELAFLRGATETSLDTLWLARADGSGARSVTDQPVDTFAWSPSGSTLVVTEPVLNSPTVSSSYSHVSSEPRVLVP
jgi:Tol biopolymer transport system component